MSESTEGSSVASEKFQDPAVTASGEPRASVELTSLDTLWFNTGTLCNLECAHCYIESSPRNDRLAYLSNGDVLEYLDEIERDGLPTRQIGFTGGEPFVNPEIVAMLESCLVRDFHVLALTNAMTPMRRCEDELLALRDRYGKRLTLRVSLDHYTQELHERERGPGSWKPAIRGLRWLSQRGFDTTVAGRTLSGEAERELRDGYAFLFRKLGVPIDAFESGQLVLFPEMDPDADVSEITEGCWDLLGLSPTSVMCATSRMIVRRRETQRTSVVACTLLPYDPGFELGSTLEEASGDVPLNHPHCARFCVLGRGSCSPSSAPAS